jgi:CRP-like cAMP-binding protein
MLSTVDRVLFLMRAGITAEATTDALSRLSSSCREIEATRGDKLFEAGDEPDAMFIVLDGVVRVDVEGAPPRLAEPGDWVGAMPLLTGASHAGTATVLVESHFLRVDRAELEELLDEDGELARAVMAGILRSLTTMIPSAAEGA